ncbi:IS30 family transposase [Candidatus Gottesmanbacteria bacterium]|nr:IS30 family transposase [Candidatus Gottesmanbacteria bacterium]
MDTKHHTKLTAHERDLIAVWKGGGISLREIGRRLGRSHSTIVEEIQRNNFQGKYYVAIHAQAMTEERKIKARKRYPLKDPETYSFVLEKLRSGWSPEQIAGRLRKEHGQTIICQETIYRYIYSPRPEHQETELEKLWEYLPWKRQKRRKKQGRKVQRANIPQRVSIHLRPAQIDTRMEFGHWEGDTIEGKGHKEGIHTEVERISRYLVAKKVDCLESRLTIIVQINLFTPLPKMARKSTTLDNGKENHDHFLLKQIEMQTYFADPYSSWQRGTNEYHNGLLRRYFPKGTALNDLTQEELDDIVWEINNRPRKGLKYSTPQEIFNSYLDGRIQNRM